MFGTPGLSSVVLITTLISATSGLLFGYDLAVISGALLQIAKEFSLTTFEKELTVSTMLAGAIVGSLVAGSVADHYGRKVTIIISCLFFIGSSVMLSTCQIFPLLIVGRFLMGLAVSISAIADLLYVSELSPPSIRGGMVSVNEVAVTFGILVSYLCNYIFSTYFPSNGWRYMFLLPSIPAFFQACVTPFLPESPRWLVAQGQNEKALAVLFRIRGGDQPELVTQELDSIVSGIRSNLSFVSRHSLDRFPDENCDENEVAPVILGPIPGNDEDEKEESEVEQQRVMGQAYGEASFPRVADTQSCSSISLQKRHKERIFFMVSTDAAYMRGLVIGAGITLFQQLSGQPTILYYLAVIFTDAGFSSNDALIATVFVSFSKFLATLWSVFYVDRFGRRALLLLGVSLMIFSLIVFSLTFHQHHIVAVVSCMLFVSGYGIGYGPNTWLLQLELFSQYYRAQGLSFLNIFNWTISLIVSLTFLTILNGLGTTWNFLMYAFLGFISLVFIYCMVPETKGISLERTGNLLNRSFSQIIRENICKRRFFWN